MKRPPGLSMRCASWSAWRVRGTLRRPNAIVYRSYELSGIRERSSALPCMNSISILLSGYYINGYGIRWVGMLCSNALCVPTFSISLLMSSTVILRGFWVWNELCDWCYFNILKAISPVPPATSSTLMESACCALRLPMLETKVSFQHLWIPNDNTSFIKS
jgi:hypothetical protein